MTKAKIEKQAIVIKVPFADMPKIVEAAWACNALEVRFKVTDTKKFAEAFLAELNSEEEDGSTPIHRMFDSVINSALDNGADGIEEHEEQEA